MDTIVVAMFFFPRLLSSLPGIGLFPKKHHPNHRLIPYVSPWSLFLKKARSFSVLSVFLLSTTNHNPPRNLGLGGLKLSSLIFRVSDGRNILSW